MSFPRKREFMTEKYRKTMKKQKLKLFAMVFSIFVLLTAVFFSNALYHFVLPSPEYIKKLENSEQVALYSLEPIESKASDKESFFDYSFMGQSPKILGKIELSTVQADALISKLGTIIQKGPQITMAGCFEPRHAVQIQNGSDIYDFIICFECHKMLIYKNKNKFAEEPIYSSPNLFNDYLISANIPLSNAEVKP